MYRVSEPPELLEQNRGDFTQFVAPLHILSPSTDAVERLFDGELAVGGVELGKEL